MKRKLFLLLLIILKSWAFAYDFKVADTNGNELFYSFMPDSMSVGVTYDTEKPFTWGNNDTVYLNYNSDTMRIPPEVMYQGEKYPVTALLPNSFSLMNERVTTLLLPATIDSICTKSLRRNVYSVTCGAFYWNNYQHIIVSNDNPIYCSDKGIVYTKDMQTLVVYPALNRTDSVFVKEGVTQIGDGAYTNTRNIKYLELPLSLKSIGEDAFSGADSLKHLVVQDSVEYIARDAFDCYSLTHLTLGKGIKIVDKLFLYSDSAVNIYCRATEPPSVSGLNSEGMLLPELRQRTTLYVPMRSIEKYRNASGWSTLSQILPIEPPIVAGVDEMTVSWVQNFSATEYVWTLYSDESHTDMVMSLTFNEKGYLTDIILGSLAPSHVYEANAPMRMSAADGDDTVDNERRFAEYYSFTIKSLTPNTKYYYTRQTLADDEVIDEEHGSFATLPDTGTGMEQHPSMEVPAASNKLIRDGQLQIRCHDKTYTVQGVETK